MSETNGDVGGLTTDNAPPVQATPAPAPVQEPAPVAVDPLDGERPVSQAVFDRGYVESVRLETSDPA